MKNLIETSYYFIVGHGRGWAFSSSDLLGRYTRSQADNLLSELVKQGKIRRVARGIYDYPGYSKLLKKELSPDIDQVARAYARKFNWHIEVSGDTALSLLGLSTQVPASYFYLSNGPNRSYNVMGRSLKFKKSNLKNIGFKHRESMLLVQALKALGKERVNSSVIKKIRKYIEPARYKIILKDTKTVTGWVYESIVKICKAGD